MLSKFGVAYCSSHKMHGSKIIKWCNLCKYIFNELCLVLFVIKLINFIIIMLLVLVVVGLCFLFIVLILVYNKIMVGKNMYIDNINIIIFLTG